LVFDVLIKSLDSIDANGNALLESATLFEGASIKAVHSSNGEVYTKSTKEDIGTNEYENKEANPTVEGLDIFQSIQKCIKNGLAVDNAEALSNDTSINNNHSDEVAIDKWKQDMRGSALAGFQLAMRAGPLCEEPLRGVAVILETVEVAVTKNSSGEYTAAKDITGGMVVAALRSGIRCALM
jgi:ribosome assembly protein 1